MLTVGDLLTETCIDLDYQGQGVIKYEDYVIFVKGLLIDEVANIKITKLNKNFGEGKVYNIIKRSEHRIDHPQSILGSCDLLFLTPSEQLKWQERITKETFKKIWNKDVNIKPIITDGKDTHYRNKTVFHVMEKNILSLGLYHKDIYKLIEVSEFILADQVTNHIISILTQKKINVDYKSFKHLVIRTNQKGEALITCVANNKNFQGLSEIVSILSKHKYVVGVTVNINHNPKTILGNKSFTLYGENRINERIKDIDISIDDQSFFQINLPVIEKAYHLIRQEIKKGWTVIDTYSGVGSIGFYLADLSSKITMIESNQASVMRAKEIKEKNQLDHIEIICEKAELEIHKHQADILIVDPPRAGLMPELIESIRKTRFKKLIYLSCNARTLARDLKLLDDQYVIDSIYPIKMFFHTTSLETLVILNHRLEG